MVHPDFTILFVDNPLASADFYQSLFGVEPVEKSPTFTLFVLNTGMKLGLWSRHTAEPSVKGECGGGSEICLHGKRGRGCAWTRYADWTRNAACAYRPGTDTRWISGRHVRRTRSGRASPACLPLRR
jgi:catechol 2,3-dioxygenase-like lactoylglutathione lyase family enzyme